MSAVMGVHGRGYWVIVLTLLLAMVLAIVSLPDFLPAVLGFLRPDWVALVLMYWVIALPHRVGVVTAWCAGLLMDVLLGTLLGQYAIIYSLLAWGAASFYQQLRIFTVWQQALLVGAFLCVAEGLALSIEVVAGLGSWNLWYFMSAVVGAFIWPWVYLVLRFLRRQLRVT